MRGERRWEQQSKRHAANWIEMSLFGFVGVLVARICGGTKSASSWWLRSFSANKSGARNKHWCGGCEFKAVGAAAADSFEPSEKARVRVTKSAARSDMILPAVIAEWFWLAASAAAITWLVASRNATAGGGDPLTHTHTHIIHSRNYAPPLGAERRGRRPSIIISPAEG